MAKDPVVTEDPGTFQPFHAATSVFQESLPSQLEDGCSTPSLLSHSHMAPCGKEGREGVKTGASSLCSSLVAGRIFPEASSDFPLGACWLLQHHLPPGRGG